jgi:hypothetical protein
MKPKLGKCTANDSTQEAVTEAVFNQGQYDFHFARGERLPSKVALHDSAEWTLSDYKPFGGVMLPSMLRQRDSIGIVLDLKMRYEINPEVPSGLIDSDPTQTMAPEGWRKVKSNGKTH